MSENHRPSSLNPGDPVVITYGAFAGMPGEVIKTDDPPGTVDIQLVVFGRPIPVLLEPWQVQRSGATDPPP